MDDQLLAAIGKLTLGTMGWVIAWILWKELKETREKLYAMLPSMATVVAENKASLIALTEAVKAR